MPRAKVVRPLTKNTLNAALEMERLGINPIEMLNTVYHTAMRGYLDSKEKPYNSDPGPGYLQTAVAAASKMASFRYPTLSAIGVKDLTDSKDSKPLSTSEAIAIIESDPFNVKKVSSKEIVEALGENKNTALISGKENK